ncbi:flagellar M-ring protein FliF [Streptohalobacillus salinus]|uniref:Flagellar M-ring protein n=1 Tax=Streptohalobacillus salinus TaxID=621096 RepID=A0A2V3WGK2_9BACI|nr:flagellar basal-body MS-ring/collar protein FliF [Streptohalobacillus salinus]PXW92534.1 flagellar M-ring protein FliF [Streptohalobacillus salinus]
MKEKMNQYRQKITEIWQARSKKQRGLLLSSLLIIFVIVIGGSLFFSRSNMVPLYTDLTTQESGQIKLELDARGVEHEIANGGTTVYVPEASAESLLVELAAQGIPNSGSIDYSFFSENTSWGVTDNEFGMIRLDAMQSELGNLLTSFSGIDSASVMINLPEEQVFIRDQVGEATAAINLSLTPGYNFENEQIRALYHLVSKSVPNLSTDNIVIMDQYFNYYDLNQENDLSTGNVYATQQQIKQDIERDIQRRVQQMLSAMIGPEKVIASVTADIDFTQENRVEQLVEPVDPETMEGIPISVETIRETYSGVGAAEGAVGAGDEDVTNYPLADGDGNGDYALEQDSINFEVNRIQREISESPYRLRDLGIQVAVDNTRADADGEAELLTAAEQADVEASIQSILDSIITTSINQDVDAEDLINNTSVVFQTFQGLQNQQFGQGQGFNLPTWAYLLLGGLLLGAIIAIGLLLRRRKEAESELTIAEETVEQTSREVPDIEEPEDTESSIKRKQLEKMAVDKPDDFAKLLRSWISEE